jgi:hypothetical protein
LVFPPIAARPHFLKTPKAANTDVDIAEGSTTPTLVSPVRLPCNGCGLCGCSGFHCHESGTCISGLPEQCLCCAAGTLDKPRQRKHPRDREQRAAIFLTPSCSMSRHFFTATDRRPRRGPSQCRYAPYELPEKGGHSSPRREQRHSPSGMRRSSATVRESSSAMLNPFAEISTTTL